MACLVRQLLEESEVNVGGRAEKEIAPLIVVECESRLQIVAGRDIVGPECVLLGLRPG